MLAGEWRGAAGPTRSSMGRELTRERWAGMNWERYFDSLGAANMRVERRGVFGVEVATLMASSRERMGWIRRVGVEMRLLRRGDDLGMGVSNRGRRG